MNIGVIKISNTAQVIVIHDNSVCVIRELDMEDVLTSAYQTLAQFSIDKLKVIFPFNVELDIKPEYTVSFPIKEASRERYSVLANGDKQRIIDLATEIGAKEVEIFDLLSGVIQLNNGVGYIALTEGPSNTYSVIAVNESNDIVEYKSLSRFSAPVIRGMMDKYRIPVKNLYDKSIRLPFKNYNLIDEELRQHLGIYLFTVMNSIPVYKASLFGSENNIEEEPIQEYIPEEKPRYEERASEIIPMIDEDNPSKKSQADEDSNEESNEKDYFNVSSSAGNTKKYKGLNKVLAVVCIGACCVTGFSFAFNKMGPSAVSNLNQTIGLISQNLPQQQKVVNYYNAYNKGLATGKNIDSTVLDNIDSIKFNGVLAEVKLDNLDVGVQVYIKDASELDSIKSQLSKYYKITSVDNLGPASLGNTTLYKYSINGTITG